MKKFSLFLIFLICISFIVATDYGDNIETSSYNISRSEINRVVNPGELFLDYVEVTNNANSNLVFSATVSGDASGIVDVKNSSLIILPGKSERIYFLITGREGDYSGVFSLFGAVNAEIPLNISVRQVEDSAPFLLEVFPVRNRFSLNQDMAFNINIKKLKINDLEFVGVEYILYPPEGDAVLIREENKSFLSSTNYVERFPISEEFSSGEYHLEVIADYEGYTASDKAPFLLYIPFFQRNLFGFLPFWLLFLIFGFFLLAFLTIYIIKKRIESKKKYKMKLDYATLPKENKDFFYLGKIAETNHKAFLDPGRLTTHSIVAGATGGGKSISAQVIVEEALKKNIAVIVFDPTAQWSGMLRKCTDKKMMAYYPKFGLKPQDSQAFKGNIRMVKNERQVIDITKHINPGQIQIFSLNKLDPSKMDIFVASVIKQIFSSDPKEFPSLKVLLVFDEVHRLLPKFGGNGEGFLQIERACREFRKWGLGVMLVSQVLNDFVGEIKANISTEVQMRTRDEGDLNRIKTKHGEEFLQSLVKASVGVGMFSNPAYNHAKPYFVNFRPILHNTRRLSDEELEKYNDYNDKVDDLEFQIDELEKEKVDTFDLKMELKLVKDKIMSGSFSVVEIYLEGLKPRVEKEWEKLGKKAPERKIKLVSQEEIQKSIDEAKKKRAEVESKEEKTKAKEEKKAAKENVEEKIVASLTFDNGVMISSMKELKDYLPSMDNGVFSIHVNADKNEIAKWVTENFGEEEGNKLSGADTRDKMIEALKNFGKKGEGKTVSKKVAGGKKSQVKNEVKELPEAEKGKTGEDKEPEKKLVEKTEEKKVPVKKVVKKTAKTQKPKDEEKK